MNVWFYMTCTEIVYICAIILLVSIDHPYWAGLILTLHFIQRLAHQKEQEAKENEPAQEVNG